ncbi:MAG: ATP-binding protein [Rhodoglobus sp.]
MQELAPILAGSNPWWSDPRARARPAGLVERPELHTLLADFVELGWPQRAHALIGPRQVGKTSIARQVIDHHLDAGWPAGRVLYFDFSSSLLTSAVTIETVLEQIKPGTGPRLVVFDEVTHAPRWSQALKELVDLVRRGPPHGDDRVLVLDSSAAALRGGAIDDLEGRVVEHRIEGLDYVSFLKRLLLPEETIEALRARLPDPLGYYLARGGLPGVSEINDVQRARELIRSDLVDVAIRRDVAEGGRDAVRIQRLFTYLVRASGSQVKSTEVARDLLADGGEATLDPRTVDAWIGLLVKAGLLHRLEPWTRPRAKQKAKAQLASVPKLYAFDPGLVTALDPNPRPLDRPGVLGSVYESAVYRHLRRLRVKGMVAEIGFLRRKDRDEIDFVLDDGEKSVGIEVTSSIEPGKKTAEALELAEEFGISRVLVIHGGRKRVERGAATEIGLEEFLMDPRSRVEEAFR